MYEGLYANRKIAVEIQFEGQVRGLVLNTVSNSVVCLSEPAVQVDRTFWIDFASQPQADTLRDSIDFIIWHRR